MGKFAKRSPVCDNFYFHESFFCNISANFLFQVTNFIDGETKDKLFSSTDLMVAIYSICHTIGMSSACFNPFLYAFLNDNFRNEFVAIFTLIANLFRICGRFVLMVREKENSHSNNSQISPSHKENKKSPNPNLEASNDNESNV